MNDVTTIKVCRKHLIELDLLKRGWRLNSYDQVLDRLIEPHRSVYKILTAQLSGNPESDKGNQRC